MNFCGNGTVLLYDCLQYGKTQFDNLTYLFLNEGKKSLPIKSSYSHKRQVYNFKKANREIINSNIRCVQGIGNFSISLIQIRLGTWLDNTFRLNSR